MTNMQERKGMVLLTRSGQKKPATMIRKVAIVQALREAFPQSMSGMYVAEEMGAEEPNYTVGDVIEPQTQKAIEQASVESAVQPVGNASQADAEAAFFG